MPGKVNHFNQESRAWPADNKLMGVRRTREILRVFEQMIQFCERAQKAPCFMRLLYESTLKTFFSSVWHIASKNGVLWANNPTCKSMKLETQPHILIGAAFTIAWTNWKLHVREHTTIVGTQETYYILSMYKETLDSARLQEPQSHITPRLWSV